MNNFKELFEARTTLYKFKSRAEADDVAMELNTMGVDWSEDDWEVQQDELISYNSDVDDALGDIFKNLKIKPKKS